MNDTETGLVVKYVLANWPGAPLTADTVEVYRLEMSALEFNETIGCLREEFAAADFPPPPMKLRAAVLARRGGGITYEQAMSELLDKIASVGYASPEPAWSHPLIAEIVRQRGGWLEICQATPARAAIDPGGMNTYNTWAAQFRDEFRQVAARGERTAIHDALSNGHDAIAGLPGPGSRFVAEDEGDEGDGDL